MAAHSRLAPRVRFGSITPDRPYCCRPWPCDSAVEKTVLMNQKMQSSVAVKKSFLRVPCFFAALAAAAFLAGATTGHAVNASPRPISVTQPDGTRITLRLKGDEFTHWFEAADGFAVVRDGQRYVYAQRGANGGLEKTALLVGQGNPRAIGLQERLRPSAQFINAARQRSVPAAGVNGVNGATGAAAGTGIVARPIAASGTIRNLVILCRFSDHTLGVHTRAREDYDTLMNAVGGHPTLAPTGSLKDYYTEASQGTVTINSTVLAWVTLPHTEAYYTDGLNGFGFYPQNGPGMVKDALDLVDSMVNFGQFDSDNDGFIDAIDIIHSGYGAEVDGNPDHIWSHKADLSEVPGGRWTSADPNSNGVPVKVFDYHTEPALWDNFGTDILRVGVIAHETGHFFGLPDLYDYTGGGEGIGSYCLMANSWGFDGTQLHPPHFSAWAKMELGWLTPTTIGPGTYNVPRAETTRTAYRITNGFPNGEYLLIENRQSFGFEQMLQGGLCIWHVDNVQTNNNWPGYPGGFGWPARHYQIALLQADGAYHLEHGINRGDAGDVYRSGGVSAITMTTVPSTAAYQSGSLISSANIITNISISGSNMTFVFANTNAVVVGAPQIVVVDATLSTESYTPTNRSMDPGENVSVTLRLRNTGTTNATVTATLLGNTGVLSPGASKVYNLNANGPVGSNNFTFVAGGPCGAFITSMFQLQLGGSNIANPTFSFQLGAPLFRLRENFDSVVPPTLPATWESSPGGWITAKGIFGTASNSAFIVNPATVTDASLVSPLFSVVSSNAQLSFSHRYLTEYGFDGGVLEISINGGPYVDFITAGGQFMTGGYNYFIDSSFGNPLAGRDAWTGTATNFITTTATLPFSAVGKSVRLRWRFGSDGTLGATGWYVDSVLVLERGCSYPTTMPVLVNAQNRGNDIVFSFNTRNGIYYAIEYKDTLGETPWIPLTVVPGNGALLSLTNNINATSRFYRLRGL
jgi:M6 family metalloprotease-like protein